MELRWKIIALIFIVTVISKLTKVYC